MKAVENQTVILCSCNILFLFLEFNIIIYNVLLNLLSYTIILLWPFFVVDGMKNNRENCAIVMFSSIDFKE